MGKTKLCGICVDLNLYTVGLSYFNQLHSFVCVTQSSKNAYSLNSVQLRNLSLLC